MPSRVPDPQSVPDLALLIGERKNAHGWTYRELEARSGGAIKYQRWQQLATGKRITEFPEPATLQAIATAIDVDVTAVVIAAAKTIGLQVRPTGSDFATMLPTGVDGIEPEMRDALLRVIRLASKSSGKGR